MTRRFNAYSPLIIVFAAVLAGCSKEAPSAPKSVKAEAPIDPWVLTTIDAEDKTPALLWNGLVGFRFNRDASSKNQPCFSIDEYDTAGEEKIRSLQSPLPTGFLVDGKPLPITADYSQSLDMKSSELKTHWRSGALTVECTTVLHPTKKILVERWTLTGADPNLPLDFDLGAQGPMGQMSMFASNLNVGPSKMKGKIMVTKPAAAIPTVDVVLTLGRSPNWEAIQESRLIRPVVKQGWDEAPPLEDVDAVRKEASNIWAKRWKTDIEIDGPVEDQQAVRSFLFYLRSAIHPDGGMAVSPFGLSNQMYNGHVFWDADTWVFPALMLLDPSAAKAIPDYRLSTLKSAASNQLPRTAEPSTAPGPYLKFAWESSTSGKEVAVGQWNKELHISGDVFKCMGQAAALGLEPSETVRNVGNRVGAGYLIESSRTGPNELELRNVVSPDENHTGNNDLYTNLLAQWATNGGGWKPQPVAGRVAQVFRLPHDDKSFVSYDGDTIKGYKQAAAVLGIYPLQYPPAEKQAKAMMNRFADKVSKNGPAMSDSVHALIWARIGEAERAYQTWADSWKSFTKQPLLLFSEKRVKPTTYFTTGAAGSLQTVLFGFLGFRLDSITEQGAAWSKKLEGNNWLSVKPNLPPKWKSVKLKNFTVLDHRYTLTATHRPNGPDAAEVIQGD